MIVNSGSHLPVGVVAPADHLPTGTYPTRMPPTYGNGGKGARGGRVLGSLREAGTPTSHPTRKDGSRRYAKPTTDSRVPAPGHNPRQGPPVPGWDPRRQRPGRTRVGGHRHNQQNRYNDAHNGPNRHPRTRHQNTLTRCSHPTAGPNRPPTLSAPAVLTRPARLTAP